MNEMSDEWVLKADLFPLGINAGLMRNTGDPNDAAHVLRRTDVSRKYKYFL